MCIQYTTLYKLYPYIIYTLIHFMLVHTLYIHKQFTHKSYTHTLYSYILYYPEELQQQAGVFKKTAHDLKNKMWWKNVKVRTSDG